MGWKFLSYPGECDLLQLATDRNQVRIPKTSVPEQRLKDYLAADVKNGIR